MLHHAFGLQQIKHIIGAVAAIIGIDQKVINSNGLVIGNPFKDERAFVFHRCHNGCAISAMLGLLYADLWRADWFVA